MEPGESSLAIMMETNVINLADIIILTGVSGVGKSTFAARLAKDLGASLIEGDDYHSPASISRMRRGLPLCDDDRWPWLCLLYTSPSPRDATLSRMPSSA